MGVIEAVPPALLAGVVMERDAGSCRRRGDEAGLSGARSRCELRWRERIVCDEKEAGSRSGSRTAAGRAQQLQRPIDKLASWREKGKEKERRAVGAHSRCSGSDRHALVPRPAGQADSSRGTRLAARGKPSQDSLPGLEHQRLCRADL